MIETSYDPKSEKLWELGENLLTDYGYQTVTAKYHEKTKTLVFSADDKNCSAFYANGTEIDLEKLEIFLVDCIRNKEKIVIDGDKTFLSNHIFL